MIIEKTCLPDCKVIVPDIYSDKRGFFYESYNHETYSEIFGDEIVFVQDNFSRSKKNVLRGLHFQETNPQGKLVRVARGEVFDVVVDLRKNSETFGKWFSVVLNETNKKHWGAAWFCAWFLCHIRNC